MNAKQQTAEIIQLPVTRRTRSIQIVKRVKLAVDSRMAYLFDGLAENVADALFEELYDCPESERLARQFNISRALKVHGSIYRDEFKTLMNHAWVRLLNRRDEQALPEADEDVNRLLKGYSDRNLNHYKILLEEIRQRFSVLVGEEIHFHPMLPGNLYLSFWHTTEVLDLTYEERKLLLPLFNRFVMDRFGQVLSLTNQCLVEFGIDLPLPQVR